MIKEILSKNRKLAKSFIWRALQVFGKEGISFFIFALCAKLLSPYDFGSYNYILAVVSLLVAFGDFGISTATSKYVAEYKITSKKKLQATLFSSLLLLIVLVFAVSLLAVVFGKRFLGEYYRLLPYALPLLFLIPTSSLFDGIFRGLREFKKSAIISLSVGAVSLGIVYFLVNKFGLTGALVSQNLFYFILVLVSFIAYGNFSFIFNKEVAKTIGTYSLIIGISSISYFLYTKADILILEHFGYIKEIGYYELINKFFNFIILPFIVLGQVVSPKITAFAVGNDYKKIKNTLFRYMQLTVPLGIVIAILFYFVFPKAIESFLPNYYVNEMLIAISILSFLIPAKIWGVVQSQGFLVPSGFANIVARITLLGGFLNVIFDFLFIHKLGFVGVFWVTLFVHSFCILLTTVTLTKKLNSFS